MVSHPGAVLEKRGREAKQSDLGEPEIEFSIGMLPPAGCIGTTFHDLEPRYQELGKHQRV